MRGVNMSDYVEGVVGVAANVDEACEAAARAACHILNGMRLITDASFDAVNNTSANSREVATTATEQVVSDRPNTIAAADRLEPSTREEQESWNSWL